MTQVYTSKVDMSASAHRKCKALAERVKNAKKAAETGIPLNLHTGEPETWRRAAHVGRFGTMARNQVDPDLPGSRKTHHVALHDVFRTIG